MTKLLLTLFLVLFFTLPLFAQSVDTAWVRRYNGPGNVDDEAYDLAIDNSGNVCVTGRSGTFSNDDYATIKYKLNGDTAWVRRYNGPGDSSDYAYGITIDGSGNIYVCGSSVGIGTSYDYAIIKYYSNGDTAWVRRYNGSGNSNDYAVDITADDSGNVYVTGVSDGSGTYEDYVTIKYYPNGDTAWVRRYNGPGNSEDWPFAVSVDGSGNIYVTGHSGGIGTLSDFTTIKYYPDGDTVWARRYNGSANSDDWAWDMTIDDAGNVYVIGDVRDRVTGSDFATIKYYPNGDTAWVRKYDGPVNNDDYGRAIAVDDSGNVYVTGSSSGSGTSYDYATIKYYSNGDTAWVRRYDGPGNGPDYARAIIVDYSGNVYVAGKSYGNGTSDDYATVKYDPNGNEVWVQRYNGLANDHDWANSALAMDGLGNIYVTGRSYGSETSGDYATIKYVQFLRGDANSDKKVSLSDIVYLINYLFKFGPAPEPIQSGNANCDGKTSLSDIVYLINYLFKFGPAPCI